MVTPEQGLGHTLQMQVVEATPERVVMTMPVTAQHLQPWGYLHGGASVALAETAATAGAFLNCPAGMVAFGQEINANHLRSVREGLLTATAVPLHIGRTSQVWQIDIRNEQQKRICVSRCTLAVMKSDAPGATNGGYRLTRNKADLSFLEVIHAIEGTASLFHCGESEDRQGCLIQEVMTQAEQQMEDSLKERKLVELVDKNPGVLSMLNACQPLRHFAREPASREA